MVDLHCHICPGLDDGASDMGAALAMVRIAVEDGIRAICAISHAGISPYYITREEIIESVEALQTEIDSGGLKLKLFPGSEVSLTADVSGMAETDELLTLADSRYVLAELPFYGDLAGVKQEIFELQIAGYRVILAHPERAQACQRNPEIIEELRYAGCLVQINAGSIRGSEGRRVRRICRSWLQENLVDVIASDAHSPGSRRPVLSPSKPDVMEIGGETLWQRLTVTNPALILKDEDPRS